jgi:hypothetical protein
VAFRVVWAVAIATLVRDSFGDQGEDSFPIDGIGWQEVEGRPAWATELKYLDEGGRELLLERLRESLASAILDPDHSH